MKTYFTAFDTISPTRFMTMTTTTTPRPLPPRGKTDLEHKDGFLHNVEPVRGPKSKTSARPMRGSETPDSGPSSCAPDDWDADDIRGSQAPHKRPKSVAGGVIAPRRVQGS